MSIRAVLLLVVFVSGCTSTDNLAARLRRGLGPSSGMVISQVYGGGGNTGAVLANDYIELFNRGAVAVNVTGWSVQYASAAGTTWSVRALPATSVQPGHYFLVQLAGGTSGAPLPVTPDDTGTISMSMSAGRVALLNNTTPCGNPCLSNTAVIDFVGYDSTASEHEGAGPAPGPSNNNQALVRVGDGCVETDDNASDFVLATWTSSLSLPLRNSGSTALSCAAPDAGADAAGDAASPADGGSDAAVDAASDVGPAADLASPGDAAPPPAGAVVISQIYGGGGNSGAKYTNDYVELFNRSAATVQLGGWSVQYGTSANAFSQKADLPQGASIAPGKYFLVRLGSGGSAGSALPTPDLTATFNMSATAGKVAFVTNGTLLACGTATNRCTSAAIMDLVGYGGASDFEGAATPAPSQATQAMLRRNGGCTDTENNASDFQNLTADARNSATVLRDCTALPDAGLADLAKLDATVVDSGAPVDAAVVADSAKPVDAAKAPDAAVVVGDGAKPADAVRPPDAVADSGKPADVSIAPSHVVVISQVYSAGGNSGAKYTNDYVELFNRGTQTVQVGSWSIQYGSAANNFSQKVDLPPGASLAPGGYFLVQLGGGATGTGLPTPDLAPTGTSALNMSASGGKVALVRSTALLTCGASGNRCTSPSIEDLVGYGSASDFEGASASAPSSAASALHRKNGGCTDTDDNAADFMTAPADPRNSASPTRDCSAVVLDGSPKNDLGRRTDLARRDGAISAADLSRSDRRRDAGTSSTDSGCTCEVAAPPSPLGMGGALALGLALLASVRRSRRARSRRVR